MVMTKSTATDAVVRETSIGVVRHFARCNLAVTFAVPSGML